MLKSSVKAGAVIEYTDWDNLDDDNKQFDRFIDLLSDYNFIVPTALSAKKHTNSFYRTYVYKLSTSPPKHFFPVYSELDGPSVANHGDDINFIFGPLFQDDYQSSSGGYLTATNDQKNVGKAMITLWTNFAKAG